MILISIAIHTLAFVLYSRSRVLKSLAIQAVIALTIGVIFPLAGFVSWALMDRAECRKNFKKPESFRKKFEEDDDWDYLG